MAMGPLDSRQQAVVQDADQPLQHRNWAVSGVHNHHRGQWLIYQFLA
jgi:hypothetical protein